MLDWLWQEYLHGEGVAHWTIVFVAGTALWFAIIAIVAWRVDMGNEADFRLDERRRLTFINLLNGVPIEHVMESTKRGREEVMADFAFVRDKIKSYRFERGEPFVPCDTLAQAQENKIRLLMTLMKVNLAVAPKITRIDTAVIDNPGKGPSEAEMALMEIRMRAAERGARPRAPNLKAAT